MFACVTQTTGMAFRSLNSRSENDYLKYEVAASPDGIYEIEILAGSVSPKGTQLTPIIGIRFAAREDWFDDNPQKAVIDIHVRGQRLIAERGAVLRVILAMTFVISRIDRGIAPSMKRVLKMYRLGH